MSTNIDQRIVEMQFQNEQFERGVNTSIQSLERLKKSLNFDGAEKGLDNIQRSASRLSFDGLGNAVETVGEKFTALAETAVGALARIGQQAVDAGVNLAKSLSLDQINAGFDKYAEKTKSVNTIMNATGESAAFVEERLAKLNWFTDETSYNFTDMVNNIGKFTSTGVNLDDATNAMMGIALEAALAGQGVGEASRAMYNFSQAMGAGSVKLMDWRSIELANMATKEFKDIIIDTAVSMGTLKKDAKGAFRTVKKGTEVSFKTFNSTLNEGWFTSDVLLKALGRYSDFANEVYSIAKETGEPASQIMERLGGSMESLGARAFKAGQVARTFEDAINATKDAVSSGWMQSFQYIFGDVEESAELWTDVTNALWEVFAAGAEERNEVLKAWHDNGGRADMLQGVYDSFESLWTIITACREALATVFPVDWNEVVSNASTRVKEFGESMKKMFGYEDVVVGQEEKIIKTTVPNVVEEFDKELGKGANGKGVQKLQSRLKELGYDLGEFGADKNGVDGIFGSYTEKALKKFQEDAGIAITGVYDKATHANIMQALFGTKEIEESEGVVDIIEQKASPALEKIQTIAEAAASVLKIVGEALLFVGNVVVYVGDLLSPIGSAVLDVVLQISKLVTGFVASADEANIFDSALDSIKSKLEPIRPIIENVANAIRYLFGVGDEGITDFGSLFAHFGSVFEQGGMLIDSGVEKLKEKILDHPIGSILSQLVDRAFGSGKHAKDKSLSAAYDKNLNLYFAGDQQKHEIEEATGFFTNVGQLLSGLSESISGLLSGVSNVNVGQIAEDIYVFLRPVADFIHTIISSVTGWYEVTDFKQLGKNIGDSAIDSIGKVGEFFRKVGTVIDAVWNTIKGAISNEDGTGIIDRAKASFERIREFISGISATVTDWLGLSDTAMASGEKSGLQRVSENFQRFIDPIRTIISAITGFFDTLGGETDLSSTGSTVAQFFLNVIEWVSSIFGQIGDFITLILSVVQGVPISRDALTIQSVLGKVGAFITNLWSTIQTVIGKISDFISGIVESVTEFFRNESRVNGIIENVKNIFKPIQMIFSALFGASEKSLEEVDAKSAGKKIGDVLFGTLEFITGILGSVGKFLSDAITAVQKFMATSPAWASLVDIWNTVVAWIGGLFRKGKGNISFTNVVEKVKAFFAPLGESIKTLWNSVTEWISSLFGGKKQLGKSEDSLLQTIKNRIESFLAPIKELGVSIWTAIREWVDRVLSGGNNNLLVNMSLTFGEKIKAFFAPVKEFFESAWEFVVGWVKHIFGGSGAKKGASLSTKNGSILSKIKSFLKPISSFLSLVWDSISEWVNNLITPQGINGRISKKTGKASGPSKLQTVIVKIKDFLSPVATFIKSIWSSISNVFNKLFGNKIDTSKFSSYSDKVKAFLTPVKDFISKAWAYIADLVKEIKGSDFKESNIGKIVSALTQIASFFDIWEWVEVIARTLTGVGKDGNLLEGLIDKVRPIFVKIGEFISGVFTAIGDWFKPKAGKKAIGSKSSDEAGPFQPFANVFNWIGEFFKSIAPALEHADLILGIGGFIFSVMSIMKRVKELLNAVSEVKYGPKQKKGFDGGNLLMIAGSIAAIAAAIYVLGSSENSEAVERGFKMVVKIAGLLLLMSYAFDKLSSEKPKGIATVGASMLQIAAAIGILAAVMWVFGHADLGVMAKGAGVVVVILGILVGAMGLLKVLGATRIKLEGLVGLAAAIGILAVVMWLVGNMKWKTIGKGLVGVFALLALLSAAIIAISRLGNTKSFKVSGLIGMAVAIGILGVVVGLLGRMKPARLKRGLVAVGILAAIIAALRIVFSKKASRKMDTGAFIVTLLGLAAIMEVFALTISQTGDIDGSKMLAFSESIAILLVAITAVSIAASKLGGIKGMTGGAAAIAAAFAIIVGIGTALVAGLGLINDTFGGGLVDALRSGGEVLRALSNALGLEGLSLDLESAATLVALLAGVALAGAAPLQVLGGAAVVAGAFAIIVAIGTAVVAGIGSINDSMDGGLVAKIESGGSVLHSLGTALASFSTGWKEEVNKSYADFAEKMEYVNEKLSGYNEKDENGDSVAVQAGKAAIQLATDIDTFYSGLKPYSFTSNSTLEGYATAPAQLATDMGMFANAIGQLQTNVSGLAKITTLPEDLQCAIDRAKELKAFFDGLEPYKIYRYGSAFDGTYYTAPGQLSADMTSFATAIGAFRDHINGLVESCPTLEDDTAKAIGIAGQVQAFIVDIGNQAEEIGPEKLETYITAVNDLFDTIDRLGESIETYRGKVAGIGESTLEADTTSALKVIDQVAVFIQEVDKRNLGSLGLGTVVKTFYNRFIGKSPFETVLDATGILADSMRNVSTKISGISVDSGAGTKLEDDFSAALSVLDSMTRFLVSLDKDVDVPTSEDIQRASNFADAVSAHQSSIRIVLDSLKRLGNTMKGLKPSIEGLAGTNDSGTTFENDFDQAMRALTAMANFMNDVSSLTFPPNPNWIQRVFGAEENPVTMVMDKLRDMGLKERFTTLRGDLEGLADGTFQNDFDAALKALTSLSMFMSSLAVLDDTGSYVISGQATLSFDAVITSLHKMVEEIKGFAQIASSDDIASAAEIATAFATIQQAVAQTGVDVGAALANSITDSTAPGEAISTVLTNAATAIDLTIFDKPGQDLAQGLADGIEAMDYVISDAVQGDLNYATEKINDNMLYSVGQNIAVGLANGISNMAYTVRNATIAMMNGAVSAATFTVQVRSPSRVFDDIGENIDLGLANGLIKYRYAVDTAVEDMMQGTVDKVGIIVAQIEDALSSDMDMSPMIRPVLDMSDVTAGTSAFYDTLNPTIRANVVGRAGSTSSDIAGRIAANASTTATVDDKAFDGSRVQEAIINAVGGSMAEIKDSLSHLQLVTETGTLIATIGPGIDNYLGRQQIFAERRL